MKKSFNPTKKIGEEHIKVVLKKINYDPLKAAKTWISLARIWEERTDLDATTVRNASMAFPEIILFDTDVTIYYMMKSDDIVAFAKQAGIENIFINTIVRMEVL